MAANPEVQILLEKLVRQMVETVEALSRLKPEELDKVSGHPCAMGGSLRKLLVHNLEHDRMHLGQLHEKRWQMDVMQENDLSRLVEEMIVARARLIATLWDLPDEYLDRAPEEGATTIRHVIEHVLYWESDSMRQTRQKFLAEGEV
jgi:uncharacterized damage-inducible protein DinB